MYMTQHQPKPKANMVQEVAVISGASGFIGSHLAKKLTLQGLKVVAIPRDVLSRTELLQQFLSKCSPDYIYHLAAYGNHSNQKNNAEIVNANYGNTYSILAASKNIPYKALINVSTSSVLLPYETFYSATKAGAERLCTAFANEYDKPIINARPYSIYGYGEAAFRFIPTVFRCALTKEILTLSSEVVHDWLYVETFTDGLIQTATYGHDFKGRSINYGTGKSTANIEIVRMIERITGEKVAIKFVDNLRPYDTNSWVCKMDENAFPWIDEPTSVYEGLHKMYEQIK